MRAVGVGIEDMRTYQANRGRGHEAAMLDGTVTVVRRQRFGIASVRDVADLHIRAMAPGEDTPPLVIHNDRARTELGWRPRPVETTIVESAECLRDLGLLENPQTG